MHGVNIMTLGSLHLTPVTATIAVRPQLHHIDATNEQEGPRGGGGGMARAGNAATAASASSVSTAPGPATRAINMTIKSAAMASQDDGNAGGGGSSNAAGGDADDRSSSRAAAQQPTESITDRLRSIQAEPWRHLTYVDEDDETAWDAFREHLVVHPAPSDEGGEQEEDGLPRLAVSWTGEDMLAAVCRMPRKQRRDEEQGQPAAGDADAVVAGGQSSTAAPTVGTAAATAPKTGGAKGKGILKKGSATSSGPAAAATAAAGPAVPDAATADEPAAAAPKRGRPRGGSAAASTVGRAPASTRGGRGGARGGGRGGSASGA